MYSYYQTIYKLLSECVNKENQSGKRVFSGRSLWLAVLRARSMIGKLDGAITCQDRPPPNSSPILFLKHTLLYSYKLYLRCHLSLPPSPFLTAAAYCHKVELFVAIFTGTSTHILA